jgi:DeoR family fructose operon transcriptional repressor
LIEYDDKIYISYERRIDIMLQYERYAIILNQLKEQHTVTVGELAKVLHVSESTIRRDITDLDSAGRLRKVFGGAVALSEGPRVRLVDMATKAASFVEEKREIARYAAGLIEERDYIFLDAGTTTGAMIQFMDNKTVTYVTNAARHALAMAEKGLDVYLIGGKMRTETESIIGSVAVENIRKFNFNKCFMGTDAIDIHRGLTTSETEEGMIKTEAIRHGLQVFVLADHSKFDQIAQVTFGPVDVGKIITDQAPNPNYRKMTEIIIAREEAEK